MIDELHRRPDGTARKRFNDNKKRFVEQEDFYLLDSNDLSVFRTHNPEVIGDAARHAAFFTESGYLLLVKSFIEIWFGTFSGN